MATKLADLEPLRFLKKDPNSRIIQLFVAFLSIAISIFIIDFFRDTGPSIRARTNPQSGNVFAGSMLHVNYSVRSKRPIASIQIIINGAVNETIEQETDVLGLRRIRVPVSVPDGSKMILRIRATDVKGISRMTPGFSFRIQKDKIAPIVHLTRPQSISGGSLFSVDAGNSFLVSADVTDNAEVDRTEFSFNGRTIVDSFAPYQMEFIAPDSEATASYSGRVTAYDPSGNSSSANFQIATSPLLQLPGHYLRRYGDSSFEMGPLTSTPFRWSVWGPADLKYYSHILFTMQTATCCGGTVPRGSSIYLAYSTDRQSWKPFFTWDLSGHSSGYYDNYFAIPPDAEVAGPVFLAFFSNGGDNLRHNIFTTHVSAQLAGYSRLKPVFRYETGSIPNIPFPKIEKEWPTTHFRIRWDLTHFSRLRFIVSGANTAVTAAQLTMQYLEETARLWKYVGGGTGRWINLNETPAVSPWIDLEQENKKDVCLRFVVRNGDRIVRVHAKSAVIELQSAADSSQLLISKSVYADFGNHDNLKVWNMPVTETALTDR